MQSFDAIYNIAAARHGGADALEQRLPATKTPEELAAIPDHRWLAGMTMRIFQAGFNWKVVEHKWPGFEDAFEGFIPARWAGVPDHELDALCADTRIIRNGKKIFALRHNAAFLCELAAEHGSVGTFFANWPDEDFIGLLEVLGKRASRMGGKTSQYFLRFMGRDSFVLSADVVAALMREGVVDKPPSGKRALAAVQAAFNQWRGESGRSLAHISQVLACGIDAPPQM
ncbi:MAG: DNA-3-methyladenine glycosylase I [Alphaproteobacteria bacterium]|nr:DNA-3-methyladenine glycosylase I [Alphaproteobacteria bacterium]